MFEIRTLDGSAMREHRRGLTEVLYACVKGGASVSFMEPYTLEMAEAFFDGVTSDVELGTRALLAAFWDGRVVGTVQLQLATPPNQPHRADVAKMLVHPDWREQGIAAALMQAVEAEARSAGKSLLTLDTVTGSTAERLYERLGWSRVGVIPNYALWPAGGYCDTTIFYKNLE